MSNMSYCRWENTYSALRECAEHLEDGDLSESENRWRQRVLQIASDMVATALAASQLEPPKF